MSASISQLEAVNDMLRSIGQPPVNTVPISDDGSDEWEAAQLLERRSKAIQARGWYYNTTPDREFNFASVSLTGTIGATNTFTKGEVVTQSTTGAQGYIVDAYTTGDTTFLICPLVDSADFDGTHNITGATSGAVTATVTAKTDETSGPIVLPHNLITWDKSPWSEWIEVADRGGYLFDVTNNTSTFTDSVKLDVVEMIDYDDLPQKQAEYIVAEAIIEYQHARRRRTTSEAVRRLQEARVDALQEQNDKAPQNMLNTRYARAVKGNRNDTIFKAGIPDG